MADSALNVANMEQRRQPRTTASAGNRALRPQQFAACVAVAGCLGFTLFGPGAGVAGADPKPLTLVDPGFSSSFDTAGGGGAAAAAAEAAAAAPAAAGLRRAAARVAVGSAAGCSTVRAAPVAVRRTRHRAVPADHRTRRRPKVLAPRAVQHRVRAVQHRVRAVSTECGRFSTECGRPSAGPGRRRRRAASTREYRCV